MRDIEKKYFKTDKSYHEDVTQDLFIKIQETIEKCEDEDCVDKFVDRYFSDDTFYTYIPIKNLIIETLRKEKFYVPLSEANTTGLIDYQSDITLPGEKSINDKIDVYVKGFMFKDKKIWELYRYEFKGHTLKMSKETKVAVSTIYRTVKRVKLKIKNKLKDIYYG